MLVSAWTRGNGTSQPLTEGELHLGAYSPSGCSGAGEGHDQEGHWADIHCIPAHQGSWTTAWAPLLPQGMRSGTLSSKGLRCQEMRALLPAGAQTQAGPLNASIGEPPGAGLGSQGSWSILGAMHVGGALPAARIVNSVLTSASVC